MAKKAMIEREKKRQRLVEKFAAKRAELKEIAKDETRPMRSKEFANDYRYFPEPDLLPVVISDEEMQAIKDEFPELPKEKEKRYTQEFELSAYDAQIIVSSKSMADFFETASKKHKIIYFYQIG